MLIQCWSRHSLKRASPFTSCVNIWKWGYLINLSRLLKPCCTACPCLYLLAFLLWHWLEFEFNQWTCHSVDALSDLCKNNFKSAPMACFRTIRDIKGWLFNSAHHLHWALLKPWALHTNVHLTYPTHAPADTFAVSAESTEEHFSWATCKTGLMLHPVEGLGFLFPLNNTVGV